MKWQNKDWFWTLGILIGIIILLIAGFYGSEYIELNFSIISSAVSIALALLAISIAIKQDGENQEIRRETSITLTKITMKIDSMDNKIDRLDPNAVTAPVEYKLISDIKDIFNSGVEEEKKLKEINKTISKNFDVINNNLKSFYDPDKKMLHYKVVIKVNTNDEKDINNMVDDFHNLFGFNSIGHRLNDNILTLTFSLDDIISEDEVRQLVKNNDFELFEFSKSKKRFI